MCTHVKLRPLKGRSFLVRRADIISVIQVDSPKEVEKYGYLKKEIVAIKMLIRDKDGTLKLDDLLVRNNYWSLKRKLL